jgi:predicted nucleic-acid-binding protein
LIALDTNILIRLMVRDDPKQTVLVERLIESTAERGETCLITDPVLCEIEWVLESNYGAARSDILAAMQELLAQEVFTFEDREAFQRAVDLCQQTKVELSDLLIGAKGQARGARTTYTFDRILSRQEGFSRLD